MGVAPEKTCSLGKASPSRPGRAGPSPAPGRRPPQLRRFAAGIQPAAGTFQRTTNALASAAHDLKTPLAILNGYVELLQSEKLGALNERQREILGDMHSSGQRLQHFIQDFLSFSVLEIGEMKMHFETGNLNACLSEVCRLWSHRFQERGLALYFLANEKLPEFAFDLPRCSA